MPKFAHIADCHIGSWREQKLKEMNLLAFENAIDKCIEEGVDFIIISGDLFHINIPEMSIVDRAVKKMREARKKEIPIYLIYGSHDYSPNSSSVIDILHSAGLFKKVSRIKTVGDKLELEFIQDQKTGAKITGISGRAMGLERKYFETLDRQSQQKESGFKIFVFHTAMKEMMPQFLSEMNAVPLSHLPPDMDYYAGGHVHEKIVSKVDGKYIVYPGPLFGWNFTDLERMATGKDRGFYIVEFDKEVTNLKYIKINVCDIIYKIIDADDKTAKEVEESLNEVTEELDAEGKIVLLKIKGTVSSGKVSDINFAKIRDSLLGRGAVVVNINRYGLSSKEHEQVIVSGENKEEIEDKLLKENINTVKIDNPELKEEKGIVLAKRLLHEMRNECKESETKRDYEKRITDSALKIFNVEASDENQ